MWIPQQNLKESIFMLESLADKKILKSLSNEEFKFTYQHLLEYLKNLNENDLKQNVQILPDHVTPDPVRLEPVIDIGTVEELCHVNGGISLETRGVKDFAHHPEQIVLLSSCSPFSSEGDIYYTMKNGVFIGNKSGKEIPFLTRHTGEPAVITSRTPAFKSKMKELDKELDDELANLCRLEDPNRLELKRIDKIQAELYRRLYQLPSERDFPDEE